MFLNMYLGIVILVIQVSYSACYVGYELFQGFDPTTNVDSTQQTVPKTSLVLKYTRQYFRRVSPIVKDRKSNKLKSTKQPRSSNNTLTSLKDTTTFQTFPFSTTFPISTTFPTSSTIYPKFLCSEDERPFNIGTYEVPTQRDMVLQIQSTLTRAFEAYQKKAMVFLQDIKEATRATSDIEKKCYNGNHNHQKAYRRCVKHVSKKCESITKSLVTSLERQRDDVSAFIEGTICTVTEMRQDPLQLIKELAMEQASMEFALPGFLRLLGTCSAFCDHRSPEKHHKKPVRHMTDQDLVIKHFLTKKSYVQLLKAKK